MDFRPGFGVDVAAGFPVDPRGTSFKPRDRRVPVPSGKCALTGALPVPLVAMVASTPYLATIPPMCAKWGAPPEEKYDAAEGHYPDNATDLRRLSIAERFRDSWLNHAGTFARPPSSSAELLEGGPLSGARKPQTPGSRSLARQESRPGSPAGAPLKVQIYPSLHCVVF
jgi:hypothetical protein